MASFIFKLRRSTDAEWTAVNPILRDGEPGVETNTRKFKIGDGQTYWRDLPYYLNEDALRIVVNEEIQNADPLTPEKVSEIATQVQAQLTLPNLVLAYENAKA